MADGWVYIDPPGPTLRLSAREQVSSDLRSAKSTDIKQRSQPIHSHPRALVDGDKRTELIRNIISFESSP